MTRQMRTALFWLTTAIVLAVPAWMIIEKESILRDGDLILLRLGQQDPRSLIQGDYMRLWYDISEDIRSDTTLRQTGHMVVKLDANRVGAIERVYVQDVPLDQDEHLIRYRTIYSSLYLGPDAYFFQEGHAEAYEEARYGGLRVDASGESVLVGLFDENFNLITPPDSINQTP